jgi:hypothetical protein
MKQKSVPVHYVSDSPIKKKPIRRRRLRNQQNEDIPDFSETLELTLAGTLSAIDQSSEPAETKNPKILKILQTVQLAFNGPDNDKIWIPIEDTENVAPMDFLKRCGFLFFDEEYFSIPDLTPSTHMYWKNTLKNLIHLISQPVNKRYSILVNSNDKSQNALCQEIIDGMYDTQVTEICSKIPNFIPGGSLCLATIDDVHRCVYMGSCIPRENGPTYAVVGGYFSVGPVLIDMNRVEFPIMALVSFGLHHVIVLWNGGEYTMFPRSNFVDHEIINLSMDCPFQPSTVSDVGEHPHAEMLHRIVTFLGKECGTAKMSVFCEQLKQHCMDKRLAVFSQLPKPFVLFPAEKKIIQSFLVDHSILYDKTLNQWAVTLKHVIVCAIALLLGRIPSLIHYYFLKQNVKSNLQIVLESSSKEVPIWVRKLKTVFQLAKHIQTQVGLYNVTYIFTIFSIHPNLKNNLSIINYNFLIDDITLGLELNPILCVNNLDYNFLNFEIYTAKYCILGKDVKKLTTTDIIGCICCKQHSNYTYKNGRLEKFCEILFECNNNCMCSKLKFKCSNNVSQQKIIPKNIKLELFMTINKG